MLTGAQKNVVVAPTDDETDTLILGDEGGIVVSVVQPSGREYNTFSIPGTQHLPRRHVKISLTMSMFIAAIIPFIIVTCMHVAFAVSCPAKYTMKVAIAMGVLNVLCLVPYVSWFAFVGLLLWLIVELRRRTLDTCYPDAALPSRKEPVVPQGEPEKRLAISPAPMGFDEDSSSVPTDLVQGEGGGGGSESSMLDASSQLDLSSESSTTLGGDEASGSSFSESSLNDFSPHWRAPI